MQDFPETTGLRRPFSRRDALRYAGAASALAGFILAAAAVAIGAWLGVAMNATVYPLVLTVGAMSTATALVAWTLVQRHGQH